MKLPQFNGLITNEIISQMESPMNKRNRRVFTDEFKLEALRLVEETDKTMSQVSRDPGIGNNLLGRWKKEFADRQIETSQIDDKDLEIRRLKAELTIRDQKLPVATNVLQQDFSASASLENSSQ